MHVKFLNREIDAHGVFGRRKSMHMGCLGEEIDAHEPSGRKKSMHMNLQDEKNRCTLGYLDGKINAQVWNLCIDFSEHTTTCALILDNIEFSVGDVLASRKV